MEIRAPIRPSKKPYIVEIAAAKNGQRIPVVNGKSLHSRYDPESEASRWAAESMARKPNARVVFVLGMGFAHHIRAIRAARPAGEMTIVVFEPIAEIVTAYAREVGQNIDQVSLWPTPIPQDVVDAVAEVLTPTLVNQTLILAHPPSLAVDPPAYERILSSIQSTVDQIAMSLTTGWGFGFEWIEHSLENVSRLPEVSFLNQLAAFFQPNPPAALVLGAGPSLNGEWDRIGQAQVLKLAVDTVLEPMEHAGVRAHLAFLLDSQEGIVRLVDRIDASEVNLVTALDVHPAIFRRPWRNVILTTCDRGVSSWLERRLPCSIGSLKQGGSVATCAFDLARQARCAPIYLGGIDFSFTRFDTYCRGTAYERRAQESQNRFASIEQQLFIMKSQRSERLVGGKATQENLYNYCQWMKDEIGRTDQPVILLKSSGLLAETVSSDGLDRIGSERFPAGFSESAFETRLPANGRLSRETIENAMKELRCELESFLNPDHFRDADRLEQALKESDITDVIESVVEPAIAVSRYEREKSTGAGAQLLPNLRDRLADLVQRIKPG